MVKLINKKMDTFLNLINSLDFFLKIILIGILFNISYCLEIVEPLENYKKGKITKIILTNESPIIDGFSDDEIWETAISITDFVQTDPINMGVPSQKTEVKLLYSHQSIFVLAKLFDKSPDKITTNLALRDDWYEGFDDKADYFRIEFDSRHDHQTAFAFSVNASGVQLDEFVFDDANYDGDWNSVWESETRIDSLGLTIEMEIPFSAFRFTKTDEMVWGLNIARYIHRKNEYISWVGYPHGIGGISSKYGHLIGLKKFMIQRKLQFKPYLIFGQNDFNNVIVDSKKIDNNQSGYDEKFQIKNIGVNIKYNFNTDVSLETTINPDFGQIEADPTEINLTAYETYYTEKRPFFLENASIFETPISVFYSRRIGENLDSISVDGVMESLNSSLNDSIGQKTKITSAFKLVGKTQSGFTYGILRAITHNELTNFNIQRNINKYSNIRMIQDLLDGNSYIGMIYSNMTNSFHSSSAISIDGVFSLLENQIYSDFQLVKSFVNNNSGIGFTSSINYESTHPWEIWFLNSYYDKKINLDKTGYLWRNNIEEYSLGVGYRVREQFWEFRKLFFSAEIEYANNLDKLPIQKKLTLNFNQLWKNYWNTGFIIDFSAEHYDDLLTYDYEDNYLGPIAEIPKSIGYKMFLQTDQRNLFSSRIEYGIGWNTLKDFGSNIFSSIKFSPNENLNFSLDYYNGNSKEKFHWIEITEFIEESNVINNSTNKIKHFIFSNSENKISTMTSRLNISFNRNASLQIYSEYYLSHTNHLNFLELIQDSSNHPISNLENYSPYIDPFSYSMDELTEFNRGNKLASPNLEPTLYPKYSSYSTNIVFHWDYSPGSSLYIVYSYYKGINGELLSNPFEVLSYQIKNKKWVETYLDHSIFLKLDYWFDI
jgi:hypothetical protein